MGAPRKQPWDAALAPTENLEWVGTRLLHLFHPFFTRRFMFYPEKLPALFLARLERKREGGKRGAVIDLFLRRSFRGR